MHEAALITIFVITTHIAASRLTLSIDVTN